MKTIYFKDRNGRKVFVEVSDEVAIALKKTRNAIWNSNSYQKYHCVASLDTMTDHDKCLGHSDSPENIYIAAEERSELREKLSAVLKTLTPEQKQLVMMLKKGMSVTEIAATLGVTKSAVSNMRNRIQEKIKKSIQ